MKTIGLLGGTGWPSTMRYYKILNELVVERLGGYHSARILLRSIDYHEIMSNYGKDHRKVAWLLQEELKALIELKPDCIIICCTSLHKYFDMIKDDLIITVPIFHAVQLITKYFVDNNKQKKNLLLATKFTIEDGFLAKTLELKGIEIIIPNKNECDKMYEIHSALMRNVVSRNSRNYFKSLTKKYSYVDSVILGCTEYPLVLDHTNSYLPIVDPMILQTTYAVDYVLK